MESYDQITIQSLSARDEVQIGYSDNDILIVDSIQHFTEVQAAHMAMNAVVICTSGKIQAQMNSHPIVLRQNQVGVVPQNVLVTDVMVTPDFDMKAMFLTNRILQSFLRDKMNIWNDMMYVHRLHILDMEADDMLFYTHFYDMLNISISRGKDNPFRTEVIQGLLRSAILGLCGGMKQKMTQAEAMNMPPANLHFQQFLNLLHTEEMKRKSVEAYANQLCITPKYLTTICKKQSGKTAIEWIREQVLEDIRYYLRQTDLSVKQIADKLGFPNASFFSKYVREHFGKTPIQIRSQVV